LRHSDGPCACEKVTDIRGRGADERRAVRQQKSRPLVDALEPWLRAKLGLISQKSKLAEAIRYALSRWEGLTRFIDDGRIEIDSNTVERSIRPIALNRKNALFAGSDGGAEHWATIASLIETCLCRARHRHVYAARRTMPNGSGMARRCHAGIVDRVRGSSIPFGIVWSFRAPPGRRAGGRSAGSGFACPARTA
jgi:transposase